MTHRAAIDHVADDRAADLVSRRARADVHRLLTAAVGLRRIVELADRALAAERDRVILRPAVVRH